jgi:hypothetical protein
LVTVFPKTVVNLLILTKYGLGCILGDFFKKESGHPALKGFHGGEVSFLTSFKVPPFCVNILRGIFSTKYFFSK